MIDLMGLVTCNGNRAFDVTMLIGEGLLFNLYPAWMDAYSSSNVELKYFENPTAVAMTDLHACTQSPTLLPRDRGCHRLSLIVCCYPNTPHRRHRGLWRRDRVVDRVHHGHEAGHFGRGAGAGRGLRHRCRLQRTPATFLYL